MYAEDLDPSNPYVGYEGLRHEPYHKIGERFMGMVGTYANAIRQNPHLYDIVQKIRGRDLGTGSQHATAGQQLANLMIGFANVQGAGAGQVRGLSKSVKMIKAKLMEIDRLISYDKDRALVEIKKFLKEEPPMEAHRDFKKADILKIRRVLDWAYILKKSLIPQDVFMKSWSAETTPTDINAIPARDYDHFKKKRNEYPNTHQHSVIDVYVKKHPDAEFIDIMLLRLALDKYIEDMNE
jgi:hypothetical protein